jgi:hypothetical protein
MEIVLEGVEAVSVKRQLLLTDVLIVKKKGSVGDVIPLQGVPSCERKKIYIVRREGVYKDVMFKKAGFIKSRKKYLKDAIREKYLIRQAKKWRRVVDSSAAVFCFFSGLIGLYLLQTQPGGKLPAVSSIVVWGYVVTSLPLAYLLYRESDLIRFERFVLVIFILLSSMSLLFSVMVVYIKTGQ